MISTTQCVEYFVVLAYCRFLVVIGGLRRETPDSTDPTDGGTCAFRRRPPDTSPRVVRGGTKKYVDEPVESLIGLKASLEWSESCRSRLAARDYCDSQCQGGVRGEPLYRVSNVPLPAP